MSDNYYQLVETGVEIVVWDTGQISSSQYYTTSYFIYKRISDVNNWQAQIIYADAILRFRSIYEIKYAKFL